MKVAVVNWTTEHVGGAETYLGQVLPILARTPHDLFFWSEHDSGRTPMPAVQAIPRASVSRDGFARALDTLIAWTPDVIFGHGLLEPEHEARLLDLAPAVFFGHNYYGTCISGTKTTMVPSPAPCHRQFGPACLAHFYPRRCGGLNPLTMVHDYRRQSARLSNLRRYKSIVTFSEYIRHEYLNHGFADDRVVRLPAIGTSMDLSRASSIPRAARDGVRLAFMGRLDRLKGCDVLLRALVDVRPHISGPIELVVAGDGPDRERCETIAKEQMSKVDSLRITFRGWIAAADCVQLLEGSDLLVVPSIWPEPFGLSGLEAIERGVPVAAFNVGGIPEWLEDGVTGALAAADPPTPAKLAAAIVKVATSSTIRAAVSARVGRGAEDSHARHAAALLSVLQSACH